MTKNNTPALVKEPYSKTVFKNEEQLSQFMRCCDPVTGPMYFMDNFFMIQHPTKGSINYHPWDFQRRLIHTYHTYRNTIALMPRQTGKCFGINTFIDIKNKTTGVIENITIGEFYERHREMLDMRKRNERASFPFIPQAQYASENISRDLSWSTHQSQIFTGSKFKKLLGFSQSWISSWWEAFTFLQKIYSWGQGSINGRESGKNKTKKQKSYYQNRLLVKQNERKSRTSSRAAKRKTGDILFRKMHSTTRGRTWDRDLESSATEMVKVIEKGKLFQNITNFVQPNYGMLRGNSGVLCNQRELRYGPVYQQRISSKTHEWSNSNAGLFRFGPEENNRVRRNILARSTDSKPKKRNATGPHDSSRWISDFAHTRRRLQSFPVFSSRNLLSLSETVERKFIETIIVTDYEILTDTGWQPLSNIHMTIPYEVWTIKTENGLVLECADTHIVFDENMEEIFVKDLRLGSIIQTKYGKSSIVEIIQHDHTENMFDVTVDDENHRFYSNGILSHNSTSAAGYLLWYAMFVPDSTILIAAHKYAGAQEIMHRIRYAYENCPDYIKAGCTTYNKGSIDFDNGSRIISATTTENTGRGMSITLLYIDEFAFVRPSIATEFWTSITPTLSTGGKCIITSTPNSDEDQFALIWKGANKTVDEFGNTTELGINGFKAYRAYWYEHPERGETYEKEMRAKLGDDRFRREVLCEFLIAEETLINPSTLIELEGIEPVSRMGQVRWYRDIRKGSIYTVALDPSLGTGGDPAAIQIYDAGTTEQIGEWTHNRTDIPNQIKLLAEICKYINEQTQEPNNIYYSIENNGIGEAAIVSLNEYGESNIPGIFLSEPGKRRKGFNTTNKPKLKACAKLKTLIESKKMKVYSKALISELKTFVANATNSYSAKAGETDDLVMATILTVRMMTQLADYHGDLEARIRDHDEIIQPLPFFAVLN